jgi:hypothetical protein
MSLSGCKPDPKPRTEGGVGRKKPKRGPSRNRIAEIRAKKAAGCRVCPNPDGLAVHSHHLVRRGAPWFGEWTENNIVGLCAACHGDLHRGDDRVKKILRVRLTASEVTYTDWRAYEGYVDDRLWRIRPVVEDGTAA